MFVQIPFPKHLFTPRTPRATFELGSGCYDFNRNVYTPCKLQRWSSAQSASSGCVCRRRHCKMCLISCMQKSYGKGYGIAITLAKPLPSLLSRHPLPTPINSHWPLYQAPPLSYHSIFTHPFAIYGIGGNAKLWHRTHVEQFYRKKPPPPGGFLCRRGSKSRTRRKKTPQEEKPPKFKVDQFWGVVLPGGSSSSLWILGVVLPGGSSSSGFLVWKPPNKEIWLILGVVQWKKKKPLS